MAVCPQLPERWTARSSTKNIATGTVITIPASTESLIFDALEAVEPLARGRRGGVAGGERRVELADAVLLLGDEAEVHRPPSALENRLEDAVVARRVGAVDALAVQAADARAEAHADHHEGGRTRRAQMTELRTALAAAYAAAGQPAPAWSDADPADGTVIRAAHLTELRDAVLALE